MDGSEGPRCQATKAFGEKLQGLTNVPITLWDERTSTQAINRLLYEEMDTTHQRAQKRRDALAASWILQGVLDALSRMR
jgi:putative Holliday junction resolvase